MYPTGLISTSPLTQLPTKISALRNEGKEVDRTNIPENMINGPVSILYTTLKKKKRQEERKVMFSGHGFFFWNSLFSFTVKAVHTASSEMGCLSPYVHLHEEPKSFC